MAPEGHGAQVLPDSDLGSEKVTYHTKSGVPRYFCFLKFLPKRTGVGVPGRPPPPKKKPPSRPQGPPLCQISSQSVQRFGFL